MRFSPLLFVSLTAVSCQQEPQRHLFVLSGQSNMARLDPDESFTPAVQAAFGAENVIVVKDAQGGQPIRRWYHGWTSASGDEPEVTGDLYDQLMSAVDSVSVGIGFESVTFVWMQGERDAREEHGEVYAASFEGVLNQLRVDLGREDVNFVIGRLSDFDMENSRYPHWTSVREAQMRLAEESYSGAWVNTDDLNDGLNRQGKEITNDLHMSADGYRLLGLRFAEAAIALIKG